jgi:hypothetical protein
MAGELVYVIMCHRSAAHVADLLACIYTPDDHFLIHADRSAPAKLHALADHLTSTFANIHRLESAWISWGGFSQADIVLRAIWAALQLSDNWSHLVPLSERHLPLQPPAQLRAAFGEKESLVEARQFWTMDEAAQADIRHRFGMLYRELAGVGPFAVAPIDIQDDFLDRLHHASNWFVLARDACTMLATLTPASPEVAPFTRCLQADELLVPSLLLGTSLGRGLRVSKRNATFIAYPHLGGTNLVFAAAHFQAARDEGYSFIRKRPEKLPRVILEHLSFFNPKMVQAVLPVMRSTGLDDHIAETDVEAGLADAISAVKSACDDLVVTRLPREHAEHVPRIYLRFSGAAWPGQISVVLLSEDETTFMATLIWTGADRAGMQTLMVGEFTATICKARVHDVAFAREVILAGEPPGFVSLSACASLRPHGWLRLRAVLLRQMALAEMFGARLSEAKQELLF